jgi:hypothetical protein
MAEMLASRGVASEVIELGARVASNVGSPTASGKPIEVRTTTRVAAGGRLSPRTAVDVTLAHPAGLAVEAKRAPLARAAAASGLQVRGRK